MSLYKDFVSFVDAGSRVPYFVHNCKYFQKPVFFQIRFEHDFRIFYKSYNNYFVGVAFSDLVRKISASDFNYMFSLFNKSENTFQFKKQLVFDF